MSDDNEEESSQAPPLAPPSKILLPENSRVVQSKYLEKHTSKKDLVRRVRNLLAVLRDEDQPVEAESDEWPGLASVADTVVGYCCDHSDKQVRLYSVLCCIEILAIHAPEVPFEEVQVLDLFRQITRQLGNLAHCSDSNTMTHYNHILSQLADVRIGCILVDLADNDEALEVLQEFIHTLLHSVRREHSTQVLELVQRAIVSCLDEYNPNAGASFPIVILDELLQCIGQGHTMWVIDTTTSQTHLASATKRSNANTKKPKGLPQKQVPNPIYVCAATVIRSLLNKIANPISQLLTGLFAGETHLIEQSSILGSGDNTAAELYNIVYELHRVAPQILTTVLGTVANGLHSVVHDTRQNTVHTLGRLFATTDFAMQFAACFREWLGRRHDVQVDVRLKMVQHLLAVVQHYQAKSSTLEGQQQEAPQIEARDALVHMMTNDPSVDVRLDAIHAVCDWAYRAPTGFSSSSTHHALLRAVGRRVSSKHKQERRDAVTGLAHIYARQYVQSHFGAVVQGGDDCDVDVVLTSLHQACQFRSPRSRRRPSRRTINGEDEEDDIDADSCSWIPTKVLECVYFTDQVDPEMRSRVVTLLDENLLGKKMTPTGLAVAFTCVLDSLGCDILNGKQNTCAALQFLKQLMGQRAMLQKALSRYIDLRAETRQCPAGSEAYLSTDAKAFEVLESVAKLAAPVADSSKTSLEDVFEEFHGARDKHIFRYLATVTNPAHSQQTRSRALEELPKRTKSLGEPVSEWVKNLVKRCAMGNSLNSEIVKECIVLAQQALQENDLSACGAFLATIKVAFDIFPSICTSGDDFTMLTQLFSECRAAIGETKKELNAFGIITALSSILSKAASTETIYEGLESTSTDKKELKSQLMQLCTRDGTPEQARNAVYTLSRIFNPDGQHLIKAKEEFSSLLVTLTSASKLKLTTDKKEASNVVSVLSALSALSDCSPVVMTSSPRGQKVVKFSLEAILLGRDHSGESTASESELSDEAEETPSTSSRKKRRTSSASKRQHKTPEGKFSLVEDESLSLTCRRLCAAVDFLVTHFRSTTIANLLQSTGKMKGAKVTLPQSSQVEILYQVLCQLLRDRGLAPSSRDRKLCRSRQDRAALRQCAAISLLRLCDRRLGLDKVHLTGSMWHTLSEAFLDEERSVREVVMEELGCFLRGAGIYGAEKSRLAPQAPALRFVAFITLCCDGDRDHDAANGSAANVGKVVASNTASALNCAVNMRKVASATYAHYCAMGMEAEEKYENKIKVQLMPEYIVPYALHLLSHRRETPGGGAICVAPEDENNANSSTASELLYANEESRQRILRKRLRVLFDPLVRSLGDRADNISFLLRMTEILGKHYAPVDLGEAQPLRSSLSPFEASDSFETNEEHSDSRKGTDKPSVLAARLKTICAAAREILLTFVKSDSNLNTYPGKIQLPNSLFCRLALDARIPKQEAVPKLDKASISSTSKDNKSPTMPLADSISSENKKRTPTRSARSRKSTEWSRPELAGATTPSSRGVHFSPDVQFDKSRTPSNYHSSDNNDNSLGREELSPIPKSDSPVSPLLHSDEDSTLGTTPPKGLTSTMHDTDGASNYSIDNHKETTDSVTTMSSTRSKRRRRSSQTSSRSTASSVKSTSSMPSSASMSAPMTSNTSPRSSASAVSFSQETDTSNSTTSTRRSQRKREAPKSPANDDENLQQPKSRKRTKSKTKSKIAADMDELDFGYDEAPVPSKSRAKKSKGGKPKKPLATSKASRSIAVAKRSSRRL